MKYIIFSFIISSFLFCNVDLISAQENQSPDIKTIGPVEMVRPTENERAMEAYNAGTEFMNQNRLAQAEYYLKEAIDLDPEFVDAIDHLGIVYRRLNRLEEAEEMYLRSIGLNDRNKLPFLNLAIVYRLQGRLNDALQLYRKVVEIDQNDPEGYYGIGQLFFIVDNYDVSLPYFYKALELYISQNSSLVYDACYFLGIIHFRKNEFDDALIFLEEARNGFPNDETIEQMINEIRNQR